MCFVVVVLCSKEYFQFSLARSVIISYVSYYIVVYDFQFSLARSVVRVGVELVEDDFIPFNSLLRDQRPR